MKTSLNVAITQLQKRVFGVTVPYISAHNIPVFRGVFGHGDDAHTIRYEVDAEMLMIRTMVDGYVTDVWWYDSEDELALELCSMDGDTFHEFGFGARKVLDRTPGECYAV